MGHFQTCEKSKKIAELWKIAISKPFNQFGQTLWHQLEQRLVFLFEWVRTQKKDTNFRENCIMWSGGIIYIKYLNNNLNCCICWFVWPLKRTSSRLNIWVFCRWFSEFPTEKCKSLRGQQAQVCTCFKLENKLLFEWLRITTLMLIM